MSAIDKLAVLLRGLAETPYDAKRSIFDVTTVMIASEFGRTLRAPDMKVDATGTNHNQYSNSILMGGKGVRGGMVIGASDMADLSAPISKAHLAVDPVLEKTRRAAIRFQHAASRATDLPETFDVDDYLTIGSVVNTLYSVFNVPKSHYRKMGRDKQAAPVLRGLLS